MSDFITSEMNPKIGVDLVESPGDMVSFKEAIVESVGWSVDVGIDYRIWQHRNWSIYSGANYRFSREIKKGIEYEFASNIPGTSDDDVFIRSEKGTRYSEPFNIKLEIGTEYQTKVGGLNFSISYPIQLNSHKVELLRQLQFNCGITQSLTK